MSREEGLVCCTVGDKQYALRGADVRQIVRVEKMRAAAGSDSRAGTLDLGGQPVPVFRLGSVLGRTASARNTPGQGGHHIAVTGEGSELVGWLVDRVVRTPLSADAQIVALPAVVGSPASWWFDALVKLGGTSILLIAPQYLNPQVQRQRRSAVARPSGLPAARKPESAEQIVLLFSTPALPRCAASRFALSGRQIASISQPMTAIPVPGSAPHVTGVAWWRDLVVPVIDFRGAGEHDDVAQRRRQVIAQGGPRLGNTLVAFAVDAEIALHRPGKGDERAGVPCPSFAAGMFDIGGDPVALLDLDALLAPVQRQAEGIPA